MQEYRMPGRCWTTLQIGLMQTLADSDSSQHRISDRPISTVTLWSGTRCLKIFTAQPPRAASRDTAHLGMFGGTTNTGASFTTHPRRLMPMEFMPTVI